VRVERLEVYEQISNERRQRLHSIVENLERDITEKERIKRSLEADIRGHRHLKEKLESNFFDMVLEFLGQMELQQVLNLYNEHCKENCCQ